MISTIFFPNKVGKIEAKTYRLNEWVERTVVHWLVAATRYEILYLLVKEILFYSLSHKTVNARENFWNVYCFATNQMRDETAEDNRQPQQGSVTTWYKTTSRLFLLQEIFNFPFRSRWKSYFMTTNEDQSLDSVYSKTKLPNRPESECKLWKFKAVQVGVMGEGFSASKNYGSKTTNHS